MLVSLALLKRNIYDVTLARLLAGGGKALAAERRSYELELNAFNSLYTSVPPTWPALDSNQEFDTITHGSQG